MYDSTLSYTKCNLLWSITQNARPDQPSGPWAILLWTRSTAGLSAYIVERAGQPKPGHPQGVPLQHYAITPIS